MILPGISWPSFEKEEQAGKGGCEDKPVQDLLPTPRWHLTFPRLARYDREGVEEFCRRWGLDIPKEQEKVHGKSTGKKKRERER